MKKLEYKKGVFDIFDYDDGSIKKEMAIMGSQLEKAFDIPPRFRVKSILAKENNPLIEEVDYIKLTDKRMSAFRGHVKKEYEIEIKPQIIHCFLVFEAGIEKYIEYISTDESIGTGLKEFWESIKATRKINNAGHSCSTKGIEVPKESNNQTKINVDIATDSVTTGFILKMVELYENANATPDEVKKIADQLLKERFEATINTPQ